MTQMEEKVLFDHLLRVPKFKDWLDNQLSLQIKTLMLNSDIEQLRQAQGRSQLLTSMKEKLDAAKSTASR
jgi:hypothetical protein